MPNKPQKPDKPADKANRQDPPDLEPAKARRFPTPKPIQGFRNFVTKRRPIIEEVVRETTSGGIVYRKPAKGQVEILLIKDAKGRWTIPKGHVEEGEETKYTAEREIREETGLQDMKVGSYLGKVNFRYRRAHTLVLMTMHIFLVEGTGDTNKLKGEEWLTDLKWLPATDAVDKIAYEDIGKLILVGMKRVREGKV
jgi:ADP-ribose pyrophosphatase YjhB (NUDIX family)